MSYGVGKSDHYSVVKDDCVLDRQQRGVDRRFIVCVIAGVALVLLGTTIMASALSLGPQSHWIKDAAGRSIEIMKPGKLSEALSLGLGFGLGIGLMIMAPVTMILIDALGDVKKIIEDTKRERSHTSNYMEMQTTNRNTGPVGQGKEGESALILSKPKSLPMGSVD